MKWDRVIDSNAIRGPCLERRARGSAQAEEGAAEAGAGRVQCRAASLASGGPKARRAREVDGGGVLLMLVAAMIGVARR